MRHMMGTKNELLSQQQLTQIQTHPQGMLQHCRYKTQQRRTGQKPPDRLRSMVWMRQHRYQQFHCKSLAYHTLRVEKCRCKALSFHSKTKDEWIKRWRRRLIDQRRTNVWVYEYHGVSIRRRANVYMWYNKIPWGIHTCTYISLNPLSVQVPEFPGQVSWVLHCVPSVPQFVPLL